MRHGPGNDLLAPACLIAIFAGFAAHLVFGEMILPVAVAILLGAALGLAIAASSPVEREDRPAAQIHAASSSRTSRGSGAPWG